MRPILLEALPIADQVARQSSQARLLGLAALGAAVIAILLFFLLRIPACLKALTGLGRKREIARLKARGKTGRNRRNQKKKAYLKNAADMPTGSLRAPDPPAGKGHPLLIDPASYRKRPLPEGFVIELELGPDYDTGRNDKEDP